MATDIGVARKIGVVRLAVTGAIAAAVVFILCWLGTLLPASSPTHAYISLFTKADVGSAAALGEGALWSFLFGGLTGAVVAAVYNSLARLDRR